MKALVLAAGIGSRLRPITLDRPKCGVTVGGTPILAHQLRAYADAGITDVTVVAGYLADHTRSLCRAAEEEHDISVAVIENEVYANTDNLYSFHLAREALAGEPFVLSNGDVVFDPAVLSRLVDADAEDAIACDTSLHSDEAMKVTLDDRGRIDAISKEFGEADAHACSIDVYRFSADTSARLFEHAGHLLDAEERYTGWTELAIDRLLGDRISAVEPVDIAGARWVEIDDFDDLAEADRRFSSLGDLGAKEAVFFDLDGTIYLGGDLIDGAASVVDALRERDVSVFFLSNNSSRWKPEYAEKLDALGIPARTDDVILSTDGVIDYLVENGAERTYVVGTEAMRGAIEDHDIAVESDSPEYVVVGFDTELTYEKVRRATLAIRDGATFLLAHPDRVCPTNEGFVPDCGSIGALVEAATDRRPSRVFGKPGTEMVSHVLDDRGIDPADALVVGDRLETDVRMAEALGCESVCVLSGDTDRTEIERSDVNPSLIAPDVGALAAFFADSA